MGDAEPGQPLFYLFLYSEVLYMISFDQKRISCHQEVLEKLQGLVEL